MKIGKLEKGRMWNYGIQLESRDWTVRRWSPSLMIWCFKLIKIPKEGGLVQRGVHFKGIWWTFAPVKWFYLHTIWKRWTIVIPRNKFTRKLYQWRILRSQVYSFQYPIKFTK